MTKKYRLACALVLAAGTLATGGPAVWAEPLSQGTGPSVVVSPASVGPGEAVRVMVSGIGGLPAAGTSLCIGFLGPGNNLELGVSPSFRSRLGTVAISGGGTGTAEVRVPVQAAAGTYRIRVGGCPPQPDLAPLAAIAEGELSVVRSGPTGLPATGGFPRPMPMPMPTVGAAMVLGWAAWQVRRRSL